MICGLVLAAGAGSRFGREPKLLARVDGRPLLEHALAAQCGVVELQRVVVVLGANAARLRAGVRFGRAEPVLCENWADGIAASLRCGVGVLPRAGKVIVTLGDEPLVSSAVIARFVGEPPGARAVYRGRPGHPVVLGPAQLHALARLTGDQGARELIRGGPEIECAELCANRDVDTADDLEALREELETVGRPEAAGPAKVGDRHHGP
ncbi:MAG TPA: nucleotidyltransferase family protein [Polyangia bacterium]